MTHSFSIFETVGTCQSVTNWTADCSLNEKHYTAMLFFYLLLFSDYARGADTFSTIFREKVWAGFGQKNPKKSAWSTFAPQLTFSGQMGTDRRLL